MFQTYMLSGSEPPPGVKWCEGGWHSKKIPNKTSTLDHLTTDSNSDPLLVILKPSLWLERPRATQRISLKWTTENFEGFKKGDQVQKWKKYRVGPYTSLLKKSWMMWSKQSLRQQIRLTPLKTNSKSPWKSMVGRWNVLLGWPIFRGELLVSGRVSGNKKLMVSFLGFISPNSGCWLVTTRMTWPFFSLKESPKSFMQYFYLEGTGIYPSYFTWQMGKLFRASSSPLSYQISIAASGSLNRWDR